MQQNRPSKIRLNHRRPTPPTSQQPSGLPASHSPSFATMASHNAQQEHHYHPQDALSAATKATTLTGGVGLFASAVQNTLTKQNVGPMGVFIKSGGTIGIFGMGFFSDS